MDIFLISRTVIISRFQLSVYVTQPENIRKRAVREQPLHLPVIDFGFGSANHNINI